MRVVIVAVLGALMLLTVQSAAKKTDFDLQYILSSRLRTTFNSLARVFAVEWKRQTPNPYSPACLAAVEAQLALHPDIYTCIQTFSEITEESEINNYCDHTTCTHDLVGFLKAVDVPCKGTPIAENDNVSQMSNVHINYNYSYAVECTLLYNYTYIYNGDNYNNYVCI